MSVTLTIDRWLMLTDVDLTGPTCQWPNSLWPHLSVWMTLMTSCWRQLDPTCQLRTVMLMSCWRQQATWTNHSMTRVSLGLIQPFCNFRNRFKLRKFITNSYDLGKIRNQDQNSSQIKLYQWTYVWVHLAHLNFHCFFVLFYRRR